MRKVGLLLLVICLVISNFIVWNSNIGTYKVALANKETKQITQYEELDSSNDSTNEETNSSSVYVPILMYHYIRDYKDRTDDPIGKGLSVSPETFARQMQEIADADYQPITLTQFANKEFGSKPIVITFDDGYEDAFTQALPILKRHRFTATFFIITGFVGEPGYMSQSQINSLKQLGMEIGGHSVDHKNLASLHYEKQLIEIADSLTNADNVFCYPSGKYDIRSLDIVSGIGVKAAVTTNIGIATDQSNVYELPRIRVKETTKLLKRIDEEIKIAQRLLSASQRTKD